ESAAESAEARREARDLDGRLGPGPLELEASRHRHPARVGAQGDDALRILVRLHAAGDFRQCRPVERAKPARAPPRLLAHALAHEERWHTLRTECAEERRP